MNVFSMIPAAIDVLRAGEEVKRPGAWKVGVAVAGLLIAVNNFAKAAGYDLGIADDVLLALGTGFAGLFTAIATVVSSKDIGVLRAKDSPAVPDL